MFTWYTDLIWLRHVRQLLMVFSTLFCARVSASGQSCRDGTHHIRMIVAISIIVVVFFFCFLLFLLCRRHHHHQHHHHHHQWNIDYVSFLEGFSIFLVLGCWFQVVCVQLRLVWVFGAAESNWKRKSILKPPHPSHQDMLSRKICAAAPKNLFWTDHISFKHFCLSCDPKELLRHILICHL